MANQAEHYTNLLAPVYLWMAGGLDDALAQGTAEVEPYRPSTPSSQTALDLGAGFGIHSIPLARMGYSVTAIQ